MKNLKTKYMGLELSSPIIAGSCGLTNSIENIMELEKAGAGAVVLKSLFEEEIQIEMSKNLKEMNRPGTIYPEIFDFYDLDTVEDSVSKYLSLIREAKSLTKIPIIASINCVSANEWTSFAKRIQEAGADALELNVFVMPSDTNRTAADNEKVYFDVIEKVKKEVTIPVALKISYYFSNLAQFITKLSGTGADALVLFNRFYSPDFDIEKLKVIPASLYSTPNDLPVSLRWVAIMSGRVQCDIASSTGVFDGKSVVKQLLAGANAVQVASALYKHGLNHIKGMLTELNAWMEDNGYETIDDFRGRMSQEKSVNPAVFERAQFMQHYSQKF
jgi:dihydroorotate dehydrogenase (fumarate)